MVFFNLQTLITTLVSSNFSSELFILRFAGLTQTLRIMCSIN